MRNETTDHPLILAMYEILCNLVSCLLFPCVLQIMAHGNTSFSRLPLEVQFPILRYALDSARALGALIRVCRKWKRLVHTLVWNFPAYLPV